jgi:hypothetical protein
MKQLPDNYSNVLNLQKRAKKAANRFFITRNDELKTSSKYVTMKLTLDELV